MRVGARATTATTAPPTTAAPPRLRPPVPQSGPEHVDTAGGYFLMGGVFYEEGKVEQALACYDKVRARLLQRVTRPCL